MTAEQGGFDLAALLGQVARAVGADASLEFRVVLDGPAAQQLGGASRLTEGDGLHTGAHQASEQTGGETEGTVGRIHQHHMTGAAR